MVKFDKSRDGIFWSFKSQTYNKVLFNAKEKFFIQGSMWRSAPAPKTGIYHKVLVVRVPKLLHGPFLTGICKLAGYP